MTDSHEKINADVIAAEQLLAAAQELLEAYRDKYRLAMGGIRESAPMRRQFGDLAVAVNECQLHPLRSDER